MRPPASKHLSYHIKMPHKVVASYKRFDCTFLFSWFGFENKNFTKDLVFVFSKAAVMEKVYLGQAAFCHGGC